MKLRALRPADPGLRIAVITACSAFASGALAGDCFDDAATFHGVNAMVLRAIAKVESNFRPGAIGRNSNGTQDIGLMQINTVHLGELSKWGIDRSHIQDACINVYVAAWHYRKQVLRFGNTWDAVGAYHSHTPHLRAAYAVRVGRVLASWKVSGMR